LKVNQLLSELLSNHGLILVDFKLEFGVNGNGALVLADELSGDTMRILMNGKHLDKELFRMGGSVKELVEAYSTLNSILGLSL
ncbi:MAG: phosphoribosylaminoimidazolesuccinocarboxamide synthase, partial [Caldivirga sp.]|uniref:phosphoribosylaminoimidazolesuccinocarboxamide synthase n=1 Tax=Caldivirga sp. TaxID=2080243 RepID=UPI003D101483